MPRSRPTASLDDLVESLRFPRPVHVTRPTLPSRERFDEALTAIWRSAWLTNSGAFHQRFERELAAYLGLEHVSLFCNGTVALLVALRALGLSRGQIITTPFTFPATVHAIHWSGFEPVFCDVEEATFNLDPAGLEALVTPETRAILPVHVFGTPCSVDAIQAVAGRHGLPVVYDAAHAFGVRLGGRSLGRWGDLTMFSFHATKPFSTLEGGALACGTAAMKRQLDLLRNFGIADEETVLAAGINGKLNELQSAYGLLQLEMFDAELAHRRALAAAYRRALTATPGLRLPPELPGVESNHAYMPVLVDPEHFGMTRDQLHAVLGRFNVVARKYFHPLCSRIPLYDSLSSARPDRLPVAERLAGRILCLPMYGTLPLESVEQLARILDALQRFSSRGDPR